MILFPGRHSGLFRNADSGQRSPASWLAPRFHGEGLERRHRL